jgi:hypothetical protein
MKTFKQFLKEAEDYRGGHTAPGPDSGSPMHDVSANGTYPSDFYSKDGFKYYSDMGSEGNMDRESHDKVVKYKGKPDEHVWIHRAIPKSVYTKAMRQKKEPPIRQMIQKGDWVTINKNYAKDHGEANLNGDYKIASMRVPASHIYTAGDSIHEWGYHPPDEKTD